MHATATIKRAADQKVRAPLKFLVPNLLDFDRTAGFDDLGLDLLGVVLADGLLDRARSAIDEVLGFFEAETGDVLDDLDNLKLRIARGGENDIKFGLLD